LTLTINSFGILKKLSPFGIAASAARALFISAGRFLQTALLENPASGRTKCVRVRGACQPLVKSGAARRARSFPAQVDERNRSGFASISTKL
jgi:hypothetical protein